MEQNTGVLASLLEALEEHMEDNNLPGITLTCLFKKGTHRLDGQSYMFSLAMNPMGQRGLLILKLINSTGDPEQDYEPLRVVFQDENSNFIVSPMSMLDDLDMEETRILVTMLHGYIFKANPEESGMRFLTRKEMASTQFPGNRTLH